MLRGKYLCVKQQYGQSCEHLFVTCEILLTFEWTRSVAFGMARIREGEFRRTGVERPVRFHTAQPRWAAWGAGDCDAARGERLRKPHRADTRELESGIKFKLFQLFTLRLCGLGHVT